MTTSARLSRASSAPEPARLGGVRAGDARRAVAGRVRGLAGCEDAVAAVEFALVLPILMTLLMAIIDWGYYFYMSESVVNAAREGARVGVVQSSGALAESQAESTSTAYLVAGGVKVGTGWNQATVDASQPDGTTGNMTVTVAVPAFGSLTGFLAPPLIPTAISYTSTMRWELAP